MSDLFSSGNKGSETDDGHDATHWDRGYTSDGDRQVNMIVGRHGEGGHCPYYKDGNSEGVVHRGHCKVCDDDRQNSSGSDWDRGGDGLPSGSGHGRGRLLLSLACVAVFGFTLF